MFAKRLTVLAVVFCLAQPAYAVDYGQLMAKRVKEVLGKRANGYTFATYPVDNFGLATAYEDKVDPSKEVCATWDCLGISDDSKVETLTADEKLKLKVGSVQYADTGAGPGLKLSDDEKHSLGFKALLPNLLKVLGITVDISHSNNVTTQLNLGPVTIRTLRRKQMTDRLTGPDGHGLEKEVFGRKTLVLVYSDIVVNSMSIDLKVDTSTDANLEAKLQGALAGKVGQIIGKDADLTFKVNRANKGDYSFEVTKPVILAVYTKKQPQKNPNELGSSDSSWKQWSNIDLKDSNKVLAKSVDLGDLK